MQLGFDFQACLRRTGPEQLLGLGGGDRGGPGQDPGVAVEVDGVLGEVVRELVLGQGPVGQSADEVQGVDGVKIARGPCAQGCGELALRRTVAGRAAGRAGRAGEVLPARCCRWWK